MKGLELSKRFFEECGLPMLEREFSHLLPYLAVGLVGSGSECFGFDDEISTDHDFEPGFCIFLPSEDVIDRKEAFALERAYAKLPKRYMGYERAPLSPVGGNRHGVIRTEDFFQEKIGTPNGEISPKEWFYIPEHALAEANNGEVFYDVLGHFSAIRKKIACYPEDVRQKKLAGHLLLMGQAGQYNYARCTKRGDTAAAQLAVYEFVKSTVNVIFLLNRRYCPYYKWSFRALSDCPILGNLGKDLEYLISSPNDARQAQKKEGLIEAIAQSVVAELHIQKLSAHHTDSLEGHAYAVNNGIKDPEIRTLHVLFAV